MIRVDPAAPDSRCKIKCKKSSVTLAANRFFNRVESICCKSTRTTMRRHAVMKRPDSEMRGYRFQLAEHRREIGDLHRLAARLRQTRAGLSEAYHGMRGSEIAASVRAERYRRRKVG